MTPVAEVLDWEMLQGLRPVRTEFLKFEGF
jgi:hypothetical protein